MVYLQNYFNCSTLVGSDSAHYIALSRPAKMTTNFRPNFKHETGNFISFTITAAKVGVFLRSVNSARNSKSSNVRNQGSDHVVLDTKS
jgi:hypothetical protein